jgi:hypothetical protein
LFQGNNTENIDLWLFEIEQYFNAVSLEDKYRATYAASLLRDGALTWWRAKNIAAEDDAQLQQLYEWETFSNELKQQFKPINSEKIARDHLYHLKQTKSVLQLITVFNTICADIPGITEEEQMDKFRRACKPVIQRKLDIEDSKTLFEMQSLAQRLDQIYWNHRSSQFKPFQQSYRNPNAMDVDAMYVDDDDDDQKHSSDNEQEYETLNAIRGRRSQQRSYRKSVSKQKPSQSKLNYNEKIRCMQSGLCFKCKKQGHRIRECPTWKSKKYNAQ